MELWQVMNFLARLAWREGGEVAGGGIARAIPGNDDVLLYLELL